MAHGVPPPNVNCVRSGEARVVEGTLRVVREHAGTYRCEATNARGSAAKNVAVTVECEWGQHRAGRGTSESPCPDFQSLCPPDGPSFEEVSCPSNWTWVEGSGQLFSCEVDGKPEPSVECVGSGGTSEGALLPLAPPDPGPRAPQIPRELAPGTYICNATNQHGSVVKMVTVSAECERGPGGRGVGGVPGPGFSLNNEPLRPHPMAVLQRHRKWMNLPARVTRRGWKAPTLLRWPAPPGVAPPHKCFAPGRARPGRSGCACPDRMQASTAAWPPTRTALTPGSSPWAWSVSCGQHQIEGIRSRAQ